MGERCVRWAGFRAECLGWRGVSSWVDGWLKGWETRLVGFGLSGLNFESPTPSRKLGSTSFCSESPTPPHLLDLHAWMPSRDVHVQAYQA